MTNSPLSLLRVSMAVAALLAGPTAAAAQAGGNGSPGLLDGLFGGERAAPSGRDRLVQTQGGDLVVRIDRLEAQIRQLTGNSEFGREALRRAEEVVASARAASESDDLEALSDWVDQLERTRVLFVGVLERLGARPQ